MPALRWIIHRTRLLEQLPVHDRLMIVGGVLV